MTDLSLLTCFFLLLIIATPDGVLAQVQKQKEFFHIEKKSNFERD